MSVAGTIAKNTIFNFIATASDLVVNFAVGIVLARSMGTEQYGTYAFLMWFLGFATMAVNLGLGSMATRFIAEALGHQNTNDTRVLIRLTLFFRGAAVLAVFPVILALSGFWAKTFAHQSDQIYFVLLAFILLPSSLNYALIGIFAGFQKYEYNAYLNLGTNPLRAILLIILATLGFGIKELLIANIVAWVIGMFLGVFLLQRLIPLRALFRSPPLNPAFTKSALKYALIMTGVWVTSYFLWNQAEVLLLGLYRPLEEVGFYTLASKLPGLSMTLAPSVLGAVLLPAIAQQFGIGDMEKLKTIYRTSARYLMLLALPLAAGGIALASPLVRLFYGDDYTPVIILMQIVFIPLAMGGICQAAMTVLQGTNQPLLMLKAESFLVCLSIGLNFWLIPKYGVLGAAIASSVPRAFELPLYIRFIYRRIKTPWPVRDTIKITFASLIMGLAVYALQSHLGVVLSLSLGIPLGVIIYVAVILALRVICKQDLAILQGFQNSLPVALRKNYKAFMGIAENLVLR